MARAFPQSHAHDDRQQPNPGEWQALRGELVALLDQVESQVARVSRQEPAYAGLSDRMRALRDQVEDTGPDDRHREALRSVKRAVDRFGGEREPDYAAPVNQPNPRDTLQSAIRQIRSRQAEQTAPPQAPPARPAEAPFGELAKAVTGISSRLERLEGELRVQARSQTGNVKEIADQVAQLSHVVELLAGAVGETGQVKRLEGQIASLARMVAEGPQVDLTSLTQRLDDLSATMGRLADLQVDVANRVDNPAQTEGMRAIEAGVRNIYDRIDAIEKHTTLAPADLEGLTDEMARFTEAMRNPVQPQGLIELIDALNTRIGDIETQHGELGGLKGDIEALREAVIDAVEPRFSAIEMQIETLAGRIADRPADVGVGQLEAQVRQLVARMDQTGEQLAGLAKLYNSNRPEPQEAPDFDALADLVAARTSEAIAEGRSATAAFNDAGMAEIEARMSRLLEAREPAPDDYGDMQDGIREVNARLARLEASLLERAKDAARAEEIAVERVAPPMPVLPAAELPAEPRQAISPMPATTTARPRNDAMPKNPADDAPLTDKPFADAGPVRAALEAKNGPRKPHSTGEAAPAATPEPQLPPEAGVPAFDPALVARPPRPESSFDKTPRDVPPPAAPAAPAAAPAAPPDAPSANTFIAAARRAAQRQQQQPQQKPAKPEPGTNSLIARALAGFQLGKAQQQQEPEPAPGIEPAEPRRLAGDKLPRAAKRPKKSALADPGPAAPEPSVTPLEDAPASEDSFLARHRKPILLAASVVALCFLTLNLIAQRLGEPEGAAAPASDLTAPATTEPGRQSALTDDADGTSVAPRIIPRVDSLATASIDAGPARSFMPAGPIPELPQAFTSADPAAGDAVEATELTAALPSLADEFAPLPGELESPVRVELPPAALGPEALREAAAGGEARAQFEIAAIYTEGRAVAEDLAAAAVWYERSAAQGFAPAQYRLGNLYEHGRGVTRDLVQARLWYQRAADAGNRMSMHNLAALHAGGELGKQEFEIAAEWFEQAAQRGMKDSQFNLGMLYARGLGVTQDLEASYKWFSIAAASGDADAAKARDDIARSLDAEAVSRLDRLVEAWKPAPIDLAANFAPIGTWSKDFDPGAPIADPAVVKSVQTALSLLGYEMGTPDGLAGPKTAEAIRQFERATGMSESGQINPRLLAVLGSQPV